MIIWSNEGPLQDTEQYCMFPLPIDLMLTLNYLGGTRNNNLCVNLPSGNPKLPGTGKHAREPLQPEPLRTRSPVYLLSGSQDMREREVELL